MSLAATFATRSARAFVGGAARLGAARRVGRPTTRLASSNSFELEGTITKIGDVQKFDSGFEKIEFVVTTAQDPYPQDIKFELLKEKIELLDAYSVDQRVLVSFNIRGNEWQGRHFVNLQAWRLQSLSSPATASPSSSFGGAFSSYNDDAPPIPDEETASSATPEKKDDLPF